jgi:hypothetical protein
MTVIASPRRGQILEEVAMARALLTAIEYVLLDSNDPWMHEQCAYVGNAIKNLENVR